MLAALAITTGLLFVAGASWIGGRRMSAVSSLESTVVEGSRLHSDGADHLVGSRRLVEQYQSKFDEADPIEIGRGAILVAAEDLSESLNLGVLSDVDAFGGLDLSPLYDAVRAQGVTGAQLRSVISSLGEQDPRRSALILAMGWADLDNTDVTWLRGVSLASLDGELSDRVGGFSALRAMTISGDTDGLLAIIAKGLNASIDWLQTSRRKQAVAIALEHADLRPGAAASLLSHLRQEPCLVVTEEVWNALGRQEMAEWHHDVVTGFEDDRGFAVKAFAHLEDPAYVARAERAFLGEETGGAMDAWKIRAATEYLLGLDSGEGVGVLENALRRATDRAQAQAHWALEDAKRVEIVGGAMMLMDIDLPEIDWLRSQGARLVERVQRRVQFRNLSARENESLRSSIESVLPLLKPGTRKLAQGLLESCGS